MNQTLLISTTGSGQERKCGPDGRPQYNIDWHTDHGVGTPHGHNWEDGKRGSDVPISPLHRGEGRKPEVCPDKK